MELALIKIKLIHQIQCYPNISWLSKVKQSNKRTERHISIRVHFRGCIQRVH